MKPQIIEPYDMAQIYWKNIPGRAIDTVQAMVNTVSYKSKKYWSEVLTLLNILNTAKGKRH